jgi:hypothetical protein
MASKEEVRRRPDVAARDLDDVIGIAARLQDEDAAARGIPAGEVDKVAAELDIDPKFVDAAIARLASDRAATAAQAGARAAERSAVARKVGLALAGLAGLAVLALGGGAVVVESAASRVNAAADGVAQAQVGLDNALDREAALAPQLVAMAGGDPGQLESIVDRVKSAPTEDAKIAAADQLGAALAEALGKLPPAAEGPAAEQRLNLQYEVVGAANRVSTERRRYEAARVEYESVASTSAGRLAVRLGWAGD